MPENSVVLKNVTKTFYIDPSRRKDYSGLNKDIIKKMSTQNRHNFLKDISFTAHQGELIGILGPPRSGKTILLRTIARIFTPDSGSIHVQGRLVPILNIGRAFLNELTATENIILSGMLSGLSKSEIKKKINTILEFAELENFSKNKLKNFTPEMSYELAFSTALHLNPDILLVDEFLPFNSMRKFQQKCYKEFLTLKKKGKIIIHITKNLNLLPKFYDSVLLINRGKMVMIGEPNLAIIKYKKILSTENMA